MCEKRHQNKYTHKLYRGGTYYLLCESCLKNVVPLIDDKIIDLGFKK